MYLGHLAAGLVVKARVPEAPLSWLLLGTVFLDVLCGLFFATGVEHAVIHGELVFGHIEAQIGYSHSLIASLGWSALAGALAARVSGSARIGAAIAAAVFSHFVLDVLSHVPDMPIIGFGSSVDLRLGTGLAAYPWAMFAVELAWCIYAWRSYDRDNRRLLVTMLVSMALYTNTLFGFAPPPVPSEAVLGVAMAATFLVTAAVMHWAARSSERQVQSAPALRSA